MSTKSSIFFNFPARLLGPTKNTSGGALEEVGPLNDQNASILRSLIVIIYSRHSSGDGKVRNLICFGKIRPCKMLLFLKSFFSRLFVACSDYHWKLWLYKKTFYSTVVCTWSIITPEFSPIVFCRVISLCGPNMPWPKFRLRGSWSTISKLGKYLPKNSYFYILFYLQYIIRITFLEWAYLRAGLTNSNF